MSSAPVSADTVGQPHTRTITLADQVGLTPQQIYDLTFSSDDGVVPMDVVSSSSSETGAGLREVQAVSYTHLTLPTILRV